MKREWENGWQGGKFSATGDQWQHMLKGNAQHTDLLGVSEAVDRHPLPMWGMVGGECVTTWNHDTWKLEDHGKFSIATPRWVRGTSIRHDVDFWWALLTNIGQDHDQRDDWTLLDVRAHLPAHLFKFLAMRANTVALDRMSDHIVALQQRLDPDETDLAMDANRDMRLEKNQDLMRRSLAGTGMHLIIPPEGTHGPHHKIDLRASTADKRGPGFMFGYYPGLDHQGWKNHQSSEAS